LVVAAFGVGSKELDDDIRELPRVGVWWNTDEGSGVLLERKAIGEAS
jgi:hypothetical protein